MQINQRSRTDLALEAADTGDGLLPEGVFSQETQRGNIRRTLVRIETEGAAERLGRPSGCYLTLEGALSDPGMVDCLAEGLSTLLPDGPVLVVGLGNRSITPDTLGPDAVGGVIATRHIPKNEAARLGLDRLREVSALSPGAMGQTGLEAAEIIRAVVKAFPFRAVVAVDALAARSMQRLGMTVQLADSGIAPGAGVMNRRVELSQRTLGLPVVSLGIPTVVDAATLLADFAPACDANEAASGLIVTPRDIDRIISDGARLLARGLNRALQPSLSPADIDLLMS